jgi:hypothetical protein
MISSKRVFIPLGLAAAVATIGACTAAPAVAQSGEPPIGAIPTVRSGADIVLPLDAYLLTGKQQEKLDAADAMNVWAGRGEQTFRGQPVPVGGCAGEAIRQLTEGAPDADPGTTERLQFETHTQTKADSRVVRVFAEWSKCMRAKGYSYPDPYAAAGDQRWRTAEAGPAEIAVATADVTCKSETNVPGLMLAVETAYQNRVVARQATKLAAIKVWLETELANAGKPAR